MIANMSLRERIESTATMESAPAMVRTDLPNSPAYRELKGRMHRLLLDRLDLERMEGLAPLVGADSRRRWDPAANAGPLGECRSRCFFAEVVEERPLLCFGQETEEPGDRK